MRKKSNKHTKAFYMEKYTIARRERYPVVASPKARFKPSLALAAEARIEKIFPDKKTDLCPVVSEDIYPSLVNR